MRSLFDLPAHPFFIHLPLVLVPVNAVVAVALAGRRTWRAQASTALAVAAFIGALGAVLAARSGEELNEVLSSRIGPLAEEHQQLAETAVWFTIAFFAAALGVAVLQRMTRYADREVVLQGAMAFTAVIGVLATTWIIRAGHEGSRIVWDGVLQ